MKVPGSMSTGWPATLSSSANASACPCAPVGGACGPHRTIAQSAARSQLSRITKYPLSANARERHSGGVAFRPSYARIPDGPRSQSSSSTDCPATYAQSPRCSTAAPMANVSRKSFAARSPSTTSRPPSSSPIKGDVPSGRVICSR